MANHSVEFMKAPAALWSNMQVQRGRVVELTNAGEIKVASLLENELITCDFLRMSAGPLPELLPGDAVLFAVDEAQNQGYVLGVIQKYRANEQGTNGKLAHPTASQDVREIKLNATYKIELRCGQSSLTMNKDGKVMIKGAQVTSRARGVNKVKGGSVLIN